MTFGVDPDTHIDSLEQAEAATVEGTSKWSCKLTITGTHQKNTFEKKNTINKKKKHQNNISHQSIFLNFIAPGSSPG